MFYLRNCSTLEKLFQGHSRKQRVSHISTGNSSQNLLLFRKIPSTPFWYSLSRDSTLLWINNLSDTDIKTQCIVNILGFCALFNYIFAMFMIATDRLAASLLNLRYKNVCTVFKAKKIIICTWTLFFLVIPTIYLVLCTQLGFSLMNDATHIVGHFLTPLLYITYLLFASTTYLIMFCMFVRSRRRCSSTLQKQSVLQMFARSKFYVAVLIMTTFLILQVIPGILILWVDLQWSKIFISVILASFSYTVDGIIYILMYKPVRNLLISKAITIHRIWKSKVKLRHPIATIQDSSF